MLLSIDPTKVNAFPALMVMESGAAAWVSDGDNAKTSAISVAVMGKRRDEATKLGRITGFLNLPMSISLRHDPETSGKGINLWRKQCRKRPSSPDLALEVLGVRVEVRKPKLK